MTHTANETKIGYENNSHFCRLYNPPRVTEDKLQAFKDRNMDLIVWTWAAVYQDILVLNVFDVT